MRQNWLASIEMFAFTTLFTGSATKPVRLFFYSESEPVFSNFVINLTSDFGSTSEFKSKSESESDFYEFRHLCLLYSIFTLF